MTKRHAWRHNVKGDQHPVICEYNENGMVVKRLAPADLSPPGMRIASATFSTHMVVSGTAVTAGAKLA